MGRKKIEIKRITDERVRKVNLETTTSTLAYSSSQKEKVRFTIAMGAGRNRMTFDGKQNASTSKQNSTIRASIIIIRIIQRM